jgi:hypothetical protein
MSDRARGRCPLATELRNSILSFGASQRRGYGIDGSQLGRLGTSVYIFNEADLLRAMWLLTRHRGVPVNCLASPRPAISVVLSCRGIYPKIVMDHRFSTGVLGLWVQVGS